MRKEFYIVDLGDGELQLTRAVSPKKAVANIIARKARLAGKTNIGLRISKLREKKGSLEQLAVEIPTEFSIEEKGKLKDLPKTDPEYRETQKYFLAYFLSRNNGEDPLKNIPLAEKYLNFFYKNLNQNPY